MANRARGCDRLADGTAAIELVNPGFFTCRAFTTVAPNRYAVNLAKMALGSRMRLKAAEELEDLSVAGLGVVKVVRADR
jgi:hypothetical protein